ncbi:TPA: transporter substrate-binding domain-containing protein [Aeromonas hydrophila]|nr:transporter substrate-binding domain-containing protein [Aeromonas hydrophila]
MKLNNILILLIQIFVCNYIYAADDVLLSSRGTVGELSLILPKHHYAWLKNKNQINIGVTIDNPPFDMLSEGSERYYEGLSADYIAILEKAFGLKANIVIYKSRLAAINDVKKGKIDLLSTSNRYEEFNQLVLSTPYVKDTPVIYISESAVQNNKVKKIAMAYDYLPDSEVKRFYPDAMIVNYQSRQEAVAAAVFGEADAVVIDLFSANYLVNNMFAKRLLLKDILTTNTRGFGFAMSSSSAQLMELTNYVINKIPAGEHWAIKKRWSGSGFTIPEIPNEKSLTSDDLAWLKAHRPLRIVINEFNAPVSYFDQDRQFHGFTADILSAFKLYTGSEVDIIRAKSYTEARKTLENGNADAAILYSSNNIKNDPELFSTKEFTTSPFVLVTNKTGQTASRNIRIAISQEQVSIPTKTLNKISVSTIFVENYLEAMDKVVNGKADATILPLNVADYYIGRYFSEQLEVNKLIKEIPPAALSLATKADSRRLIDIMNKFLLSVSPDELQSVENRWRMNAIPGQETWRDYKYTLYTMSSAAFILIIASLVWAWFIRKQYIKRLDAQRELSEQFLFMQHIVDSIPHPIYVRNINRSLVLCNRNYQAVFSSDKAELLLKNTREGRHRVKEADELDLEYQQAIQEGISFRKDRRIHIDDIPVDIYHWVQPYKNSDGEVQGIIGGWIDVSDRVTLLSALTKAKEDADRANRAKTQFLATMSHEIRTPMNAVLGLLELALKRSTHQYFDVSSIQTAYDSAKGLLSLLGDILDIIKIEAEELTTSPESINIKQTLESIVNIFYGLATKKDIIIHLEYDPLIPEYVYLDPTRLKQIISNLVGNAIKFTEQGFVKITASRVSHNGCYQLSLQVEDTGIGIPATEIQHLFKPFAQAHQGAHSRGGTGLGLSISRSLCELMGGTLNLESEQNKGTRINILLPLAISQSQVKEAPNVQSNLEISFSEPCYYILIVDDHPSNRILLSQQLRYLGHRVDEADSGEKALKLYTQHHHQVIITDCNMPNMDGYELTRCIRAWEEREKNPRSVILGYTANAQNEAKEACLLAGMDDCLFKPISLNDLQSILIKLRGHVHPLSKSEKLFHPHQLTKLIGIDKEITTQLLCEFIKTTETDISQLHSASQRGEIESIKTIVHKIKGAVRIIASPQVIIGCEQIESLKEPDDVKAALPMLIDKLTSLTNEIEFYLQQ